MTPGIYLRPEPTSPDEVAARFDEIMDLDEYVVPDGGADEVALIARMLQGRDPAGD